MPDYLKALDERRQAADAARQRYEVAQENVRVRGGAVNDLTLRLGALEQQQWYTSSRRAWDRIAAEIDQTTAAKAEAEAALAAAQHAEQEASAALSETSGDLQIGAVAALAADIAAVETSQDRLDKIDAKLDEQRAELAAAEQEVERLATVLSDEALAAADAALEGRATKRSSAGAERAAAQAQIDDLRAIISGLERRRAEAAAGHQALQADLCHLVATAALQEYKTEVTKLVESVKRAVAPHVRRLRDLGRICGAVGRGDLCRVTGELHLEGFGLYGLDKRIVCANDEIAPSAQTSELAARLQRIIRGQMP